MLDTLTTLSWPYLLAVLALALHWLVRVWRHARQGERPAFAYLAAPGVSALLAAPLVQADPMFGLGAALLLIAAYAPGAFQPAPARHARQARVIGRGAFVTMAFLAGASVALAPVQITWPLWSGLLLMAFGYALSGAQPPVRSRSPHPGFDLRFRPLQSPAWPDLELRLGNGRAEILNVSSGALYLAGWSPSGQNGWLRPQDERGRPLTSLPVGASAVLTPWPDGQRGVRVWYVRHAAPAEPLVFRADWTVQSDASRVLN